MTDNLSDSFSKKKKSEELTLQQPPPQKVKFNLFIWYSRAKPVYIQDLTIITSKKMKAITKTMFPF